RHGRFDTLDFGRLLLLDETDRQDRDFVKRDRRQRHDHHAQRIGRREDGDDSIAPPALQFIRRYEAGSSEQRQDNGKLEDDTETENQRHDQRQIFGHLRQQLDRRHALARMLRQADRKADQHWHRNEIDDHGADDEQHRRRDQVRQEGPPLVLVKPWRNELVDLRRNDWKR